MILKDVLDYTTLTPLFELYSGPNSWIIAGGSVLRAYLGELELQESDVDFYLTSTYKEACINHLLNNHFVITKHNGRVITLLDPYTQLTIQLIECYSDPIYELSSFDIINCQIGYTAAGYVFQSQAHEARIKTLLMLKKMAFSSFNHKTPERMFKYMRRYGWTLDLNDTFTVEVYRSIHEQLLRKGILSSKPYLDECYDVN